MNGQAWQFPRARCFETVELCTPSGDPYGVQYVAQSSLNAVPSKWIACCFLARFKNDVRVAYRVRTFKCQKIRVSRIAFAYKLDSDRYWH